MDGVTQMDDGYRAFTTDESISMLKFIGVGASAFVVGLLTDHCGRRDKYTKADVIALGTFLGVVALVFTSGFLVYRVARGPQ